LEKSFICPGSDNQGKACLCKTFICLGSYSGATNKISSLLLPKISPVLEKAVLVRAQASKACLVCVKGRFIYLGSLDGWQQTEQSYLLLYHQMSQGKFRFVKSFPCLASLGDMTPKASLDSIKGLLALVPTVVQQIGSMPFSMTCP
jgi:hypothetical protein